MSGEKRKRRSRKSKEEKLLEKLNKEEEQKQQEQGKEQQPTYEKSFGPALDKATMSPEDLKIIMDNNSSINEKMMDMDVRIKYGFIKTLYNNLISINQRMNWKPEELMLVGMIFRDLHGIETTVYETVLDNEENEEEEEEEETEENEENEENEEVN